MKKIFTEEEWGKLKPEKRVIYGESYAIYYQIKNEKGLTERREMRLFTSSKNASPAIRGWMKQKHPNTVIMKVQYE